MAKLGFIEAYLYLAKQGHDMTLHRFTKELRENPGRFGANRRNPEAERGKGGGWEFTKTGLKNYTGPLKKRNKKTK